MKNVTDLHVNNSKNPLRKFTRNPIMMALGIALVLVVLAGLGFGGKMAYDALTHKDDSAQIYNEVKSIFPYLLPSETPTVATVTDITKLKGQEFFRNAKNGDRVVVFSAARIAIIYRRGQRAIINFGPITASPTASSTPTPALSPVTPAPTPKK